MSKKFNVLIGGEAGQGLQTMGEAFTRALSRSGYRVHVTQTYESRVRGGHNVFAIRFGANEVMAPVEEIDLLIALNQETLYLHKDEMSARGLAIAHEAWEFPADIRACKVPYDSLTEESLTNTAAMGVAGSFLGLEEETLATSLDYILGEGKGRLSDVNRRVLRRSYDWSRNNRPLLDLPEPDKNLPKRIVLNGHEAVALGAISAGVRFCAFYPMSPSTSVAMTMIRWSNEIGLLVEQAEDEIAAINMAIGASYAGAPSLVPTSGGGFALMVEAVSLSGISETPVVVVIGQRPGPATGLATRTEQADLEFVVHAGHGEFPKAVYTPATIEECFFLTRKAVEVAERYQTPSFVLTDHFLADSYRDVVPFDISDLSPVVPGGNPSDVRGVYKRYEITDSGVSPRLLPGESTHLVVADSHEHEESGHMTEDLTLRPRMVEKRLKKYQGMKNDVVPPFYQGPPAPELLLVGWGSTRGAILEAADLLQQRGIEAACLHFSQIWPMVPDTFLEKLSAARTAVCVEGNATGQLARLIRRETGFEFPKRVSRYDGLPITPRYIIRALGY